VKRKKEENGEKLVTVNVEAVDENGEVKAGGDLIIVC
ncbi:MAG TPA: dehydratase, partial [Leptospiraceae bacterium]|nr:dehydratase [Leptospiraceae bacterium]